SCACSLPGMDRPIGDGNAARSTRQRFKRQVNTLETIEMPTAFSTVQYFRHVASRDRAGRTWRSNLGRRTTPLDSRPLLPVTRPEILLQLRREIAVDQHVEHLDVPARPVAPRVARAALNDDVTLLQLHLSFVEDQRDLPFEHDRVVDGLRAVHHRMPPALAEGRGVAGAALAEELLRLS